MAKWLPLLLLLIKVWVLNYEQMFIIITSYKLTWVVGCHDWSISNKEPTSTLSPEMCTCVEIWHPVGSGYQSRIFSAVLFSVTFSGSLEDDLREGIVMGEIVFCSSYHTIQHFVFWSYHTAFCFLVIPYSILFSVHTIQHFVFCSYCTVFF